MTPVVKNILILIMCVIMFNYISMADAETTDEYNEMFYRTVPEHWLINYGPVDKCIMRNSKVCQVA